MDRPTRGKVWLLDRRLDSLSVDQLAEVRRRQIGFVFQAFNLLPTLTVLENVALPLALEGIDDRKASEAAASALADVGLQSRGKHFPSQLSGGEKQRTAIARALAIDPQLIVADEPTGSLDSSNGRRVLDLIAELNAARGITVIMATHSQQAAAYASRTIHLLDGRIVTEQETGVLSEAL
jgi:ABC-type lipoprotein export system ATPase subunit